MHAFSVAPFDQNLSIDGKSLTDDSATLGSLGVIPESIICLKVHPTLMSWWLDLCIEILHTVALILTSHEFILMVITGIFLIIHNIHSIVSSQADEPIADYAAMDDVYQGKWHYLPLHYSC